MKRIDIQKLLSINGYWTVNKHLARKFGFASTILLQQLIDLQFEYFPNGDFYQQQDELAKTLGITEKILVSARKRLVDNNMLIVRRGHQAKYYYTVLTDNIIELFESAQEEPSKVTKGHIRKLQNVTANSNKQEHKEIIQKEVLDVPSVDNNIKDFYGKIFFKIVEAYPTNRIGNRQHGLKKFNSLTKQEALLAVTNLKRYLAITDGYVKSLLNYITEKCFTESWLKAEEETKVKKQNKTSTKTLNEDYDTIN